MPKTMSEKILAKAAGKDEVEAGERSTCFSRALSF